VSVQAAHRLKQIGERTTEGRGRKSVREPEAYQSLAMGEQACICACPLLSAVIRHLKKS
jgi:hypothetical protein